MAIYKAITMKVTILVEPSLSDAEVIKWTDKAMREYCDFEQVLVKITEKHESVSIDPIEAEA